MPILFDLDLTLVDSTVSEHLRKTRQWSDVYKQIPTYTLYEGLVEVFEELRSKNIKVAIVTNSPATYANKVVMQFKIPCDFMVDYFSCRPNNKPKPHQFLHALKLLGSPADQCISVGDKLIDYQASKSAQIPFYGAKWDVASDFHSTADIATLRKPADLLEIVKQID